MRYIVSVEATCKRRIGQTKGIAVGIVILVRQRVTIVQIGLIHIVKHHIHTAYAEHGSVRVRAMKYLFAETLLLFNIKQFITLMLCNVFGCFHDKTGRAHSRVADSIVKSWAHQFHHHTDDVTRGAELPVSARCRHYAEHVLIHVTHHVRPIGRNFINPLNHT